MRLLILGISGLALGACSFNGSGYGYGANTGTSYGHGSSYGVWQGQGQGYGSPCNLDPCAAVQQPPVYQPPVYQPPVYQPPVYQPPAIPAPTCHANPCGGSYAVSPHAYSGAAYSGATYSGNGYPAGAHQGGYSSQHYGSQPVAYQPQTPSPHAYGTHTSQHGSTYGQRGYGFMAPKQKYMYGTLGAVWYDIDEAYAGVQGRVGYQSRSIFGAEAEASIGVIGEKSPFNQANPPGPNLVGEFNDSVDYSLAGFAVARMPISPNISAHARVGYHTTQFSNDVSINGAEQKTSTTLDGIAYGAGMEFGLTPVDAIRADYTRYDNDVSGMNSVSLAYLRRF